MVDALRPGSGYSPRQILVLIKGFPLESATVAAMRGGDEFLGWGLDQYQNASLIDAINWNTWAVIATGSGKKKPKHPEPTYRPTMKKPKAANNPFAQRLAAARRAKAARTQGA